MQEDSDVEHKDVNMFCDTTQFPALKFCGPQTKPNGVRMLSKNYHMRCGPKLGHGLCEIHRIPCA